MDQTAIDRLTALSGANKPQKSKLSKPEVEEASHPSRPRVARQSWPLRYDTIDTFIRTFTRGMQPLRHSVSLGVASRTRPGANLFKSLLDLFLARIVS